MSATSVSTTVAVDPRDAPKIDLPAAPEEAFTRPTVRVPGGVYVGVRYAAGHADAAAWWRQMASACEQLAYWHDARSGAR